MDTSRIEIDVAERAKDRKALTQIIENLAEDLDRSTVHHVCVRLRADLYYAQQALYRLELFHGK